LPPEEYDTAKKAELTKELKRRRIEYPSGLTNGDLAEILRQDDAGQVPEK
jgi:hypothetical protein